MSFQPERVGPALLAQAHRTLTEAGMHVGHLAICYDGQEESDSYSLAFHMHPSGCELAHQFILANALRHVGPSDKAMIIRYLDDGTMIVAAASFDGEGEEEDEA